MRGTVRPIRTYIPNKSATNKHQLANEVRQLWDHIEWLTERFRELNRAFHPQNFAVEIPEPIEGGSDNYENYECIIWKHRWSVISRDGLPVAVKCGRCARTYRVVQ